MSAEYDLVKQFIEEHKECEYFIPEEGTMLLTIANTPNYLREYFIWKGKKR